MTFRSRYQEVKNTAYPSFRHHKLRWHKLLCAISNQAWDDEPSYGGSGRWEGSLTTLQDAIRKLALTRAGLGIPNRELGKWAIPLASQQEFKSF